MALQCRYAAQGCPGQLRGRAEAVSRRAVEWAARPSEEIRQPRIVELPLCLCIGLTFGETRSSRPRLRQRRADPRGNADDSRDRRDVANEIEARRWIDFPASLLTVVTRAVPRGVSHVHVHA